MKNFRANTPKKPLIHGLLSSQNNAEVICFIVLPIYCNDVLKLSALPSQAGANHVGATRHKYYSRGPLRASVNKAAD